MRTGLRLRVTILTLFGAVAADAACVQPQFIYSPPAITSFGHELSSPVRASAAADFNGDGVLDVVGVNPDTIFFGTPSGRFFSHRAPLTQLAAIGVITADLNGDGHPDLVVWDRNTFVILQGRGDGTFEARQAVSQTDTARDLIASIVAADFDGDGHPDLLLSGAATLTLYHGLGDGTVAQRSVTPMDRRQLVVGDFFHNGKPAVAAVRSDRLTVLRPNADGSFTVTQDMPLTDFGGAPTVGDFNSDGITDMVLVVQDGVRLFYGGGDGTLRDGPLRAVDWQREPLQLFVVADFNRDGRPDLVGVSPFGLQVYRNAGGAFDAPQALLAPTFNGVLALPGFLIGAFVADVDGDGFPDIVQVDTFGFGSVILNGCGQDIIVRASADAVVSGAAVTLTAYGVAGRLNEAVTFRDAGMVIGSGAGSLTTALTTPGRHAITASTATSTSAPLILNVAAQPSTVTASTTRSHTTFGEAILLSGIVGFDGHPVPFGDVQVLDRSQPIAATAVTAGAYAMALNLPAGTHQISTRFTGAGEAPSSDSSPAIALAIDVAPTTMTITSMASPCFIFPPRLRVTSIGLSVKAPFSIPTGKVRIVIPSLNINEDVTLDELGNTFLSFGKLLPAGQYDMSLQYLGDGNHQPARIDTPLLVPSCRHRPVSH